MGGIDPRYLEPQDLYEGDPIGDECPDCGRQIDDGEVWCEGCGAVLDPDEAQAVKKEEAEERRAEAYHEETGRWP